MRRQFSKKTLVIGIDATACVDESVVIAYAKHFWISFINSDYLLSRSL